MLRLQRITAPSAVTTSSDSILSRTAVRLDIGRDIGPNRSADSEPVGPSLLLTYAPGTAHAAGMSEGCTEDAWPMNARLHVQEPPFL